MEKLLLKYIAGTVNSEERKLVVEWLKLNKENMKQYKSLRKLYSSMLWQDIELPTKTKRLVPTYLREFLKIAAVFLVVLGLVWLKNNFLASNLPIQEVLAIQTIQVPPGQRVELELSEGTYVWLNANTKLSFPSTFSPSQREIILDGEARFRVARHKDQAFIVKTAKHAVKVVGTEFNVLAYSNDSIFETALLSGKVEILTPDKPTISLNPQFRAIAKNGEMKILAIHNSDYYRWTEGLMCFENEPIKDLINKISIYFDIKIVLNNPKLGERRYTGKFWVDDGVEHMLNVLQLNNTFNYKRNPETNEIIIH